MYMYFLYTHQYICVLCLLHVFTFSLAAYKTEYISTSNWLPFSVLVKRLLFCHFIIALCNKNTLAKAKEIEKKSQPDSLNQIPSSFVRIKHM